MAEMKPALYMRNYKFTVNPPGSSSFEKLDVNAVSNALTELVVRVNEITDDYNSLRDMAEWIKETYPETYHNWLAACAMERRMDK